MIDCETLGISTHPVILQIGVAVLGHNLHIIDTLQIDVDPSNQPGAQIDASTVLWWMRQSEEARKAITAPSQKPVAIPVALLGLNKFLTGYAVDEVWANGSAEDLVWLNSAFDAQGIKPMWGFRHQRCYRTLRNLKPDVAFPAPIEPAHVAVNDATWQAIHLARLLQ